VEQPLEAPRCSQAAAISIIGDALAGDVTISDIMGRPAFMLRLTIPRDIYNHGRLTALYFLGTVSGLGFTLGIVLLAIFQRLESARVAQLEAELRYRAIITQAAEGFLLVEPRSQAILESNGACQALLGWSASELRPMTLSELSSSLAGAAVRLAAISATQSDRIPQEVQDEGPRGVRPRRHCA
jgi:PAS domain-containing protein